jgi:hypothetical protein
MTSAATSGVSRLIHGRIGSDHQQHAFRPHDQAAQR